jgi:hypothetical protein
MPNPDRKIAIFLTKFMRIINKTGDTVRVPCGVGREVF